jgi:plastocyanin domain-containing protein
MFALGAASSFLSGAKGQAFSRRVMQVGAVLLAAMGISMFVNGLSLAGVASPFYRMAAFVSQASANPARASAPAIQIINSTLLPNRYPAIVVQQGVPVRWIINASAASINNCNNRFIIREYGIQHTFRPGENVIEFLPEKIGRFTYSCWMGMIRSTITVVAEGESLTDLPPPDIAPKPAGVDIPTDEIALARMADDFQIAEIRLADEGFEPAVIVMQRDVPTIWVINIESDDPGNSLLVVPAYFAQIDTRQGENVLQLYPEADFDFSTGDNIFYGYVKVVDEISRVDFNTIRAEVADHETLMYPDAYFEMGRR